MCCSNSWRTKRSNDCRSDCCTGLLNTVAEFDEIIDSDFVKNSGTNKLGGYK